MPHIVLIQAFRHGTGKSHLTANIATILAQSGQRVGIIDAGDRPSVVHGLFGLDEEIADHALNHYLWNDALDDSLDGARGSTVPIGSGAVLVMGRSIHLTPTAIAIKELSTRLQQQKDVSALSQGLFELVNRLQLDYLLIAANPRVNEENLFYMAMSDIVVLTFYLDDMAFQDGAVAVDIAHQLNIPKILMVVNQLPVQFNQQDVQILLEDTFGETVAGILPFSDDMGKMAGQGIFCLNYPDHDLTHQMRAIAYQIVQSGQEIYQKELQDEDKIPSLAGRQPTLFDVLALPIDYRCIMHCIIQRGSASIDEIQEALPRSTNLLPMLQVLTEQGFIQTLNQTDGRRYKSRLSGGRIYSNWLKTKRSIVRPNDKTNY